MPGYNHDARALIQKIRADLKDRYTSTFAILKELFQNADDAGATALALDLRNGFPGATNPLLRGAGLLVCNDGRYTPKDDRGIKHASATTKTAETSSAGRFGIGLKAVHHLCDAFIAVPSGHPEAFHPLIVNPYIDLEEAPAVIRAWDAVTEADVASLVSGVDRAVFLGQRLALWLPLRRSDLRPVPHAGFGDRKFDDEAARRELASELARPAELAAMMAAARHLNRFDLRRDGSSVVTVRRSGERMDYISPDRDHAGRGDERRNYAGTVTVDASGGSQELRFSAREMLSADAALAALQADEGWPQTIDFDGKPQREKAMPHGACVLASGGSFLPRLSIREGVFLPIGDDTASRDATRGGDSTAAQTIIELGASGPRLDLFLHGYYFVDPGRREILGVADGPAGRESIPQRWNGALRDNVVLPALPLLFRRAVADRVLSPVDLAAVVRALRDSSWFGDRRPSVCRSKVLAEVWNGRALAWDCFDPAARLRPLPARLLVSPGRLAALLPGLESFARRHGVSICAADEDGVPRALAGRAPAWEAAELAELIEGVPAAALRQRRVAEDFAALLAVARRGGAPDAEVGRALRAKLREVLRAEVANQAAHDVMRDVMRHVPRDAVVFLPEVAVNSEILAALAAAETDALVVGESWRPLKDGKPDDAGWQLAEPSALAPLLRAIEPFAVQERGVGRADKAARAAVAIAEASRAGVSGLASDPSLRTIRLFPIARQPGDERQTLSVGELAAAAKDGTLVLNLGSTLANLRPLLAALPRLSLLVVDSNRSELFKKALHNDGWSGDLGTAALIGFVDRASDFSDDAQARGALLERLGKSWSDEVARAARCLVAGVAEAGAPTTILYTDVPPALVPLVERVLRRSSRTGASAFMVGEDVLTGLALRERNALRLTAMRGPDLGSLLRQSLADGTFSASDAESEVVLACDLLGAEGFDALLRDLPIHVLEGRDRGSIDRATCLASPRTLPEALAGLLRRVVPAADAEAQARQRRLLPPHDALAELRAAARAPGHPAALREVILDALAEVCELPADLCRAMRETPWLAIDGLPVAPQAVLVLPEAVGRAARFALAGNVMALPLTEGLPAEVREHPGFVRHRGALLPDAAASFAGLALLLKTAGLVGLPVAWDERYRLPLTALAAADLKLPAWRLAAALLGESGDGAAACLAVLAPARSAEHLRGALNALVEAARWGHQAGDAARELYGAAFREAVPPLDAAARRRLFGAVAVATAAGGWKPGSEVAARGAGLAASCVLDPGLAAVLGEGEVADADSAVGGDAPPSVTASPELDARSAADFRRLLDALRGRIEDDLALTLLGVAGRFPAMRDAMAWWRNTEADVGPHLDRIDEASRIICGRQGLEEAGRNRRFLLEEVCGQDVAVVSLSGVRFEARVAEDGPFVIGEDHEEGTRQPDGLTLHVVRIRPPALAAKGVEETMEEVRSLIRALIAGCFFLRDRRTCAEELPGMRGKPSQAVLEHTQAALREHLPTLLTQLKTKGGPALRALTRTFEDGSDLRCSAGDRAGSDDGATARRDLWDGLAGSPDAQAELLACMRAALGRFEYDAARVVFELFQNADDATHQGDAADGPKAFRLRADGDGFDVIHWGRPINHSGRNRTATAAENYRRDLRNMLMLHVSDKDGVNTTGKHGIGFKSVHMLSRDVRIASGLLAARVVGGMLPLAWHEGADAVTPLRLGDSAATLIHVPFDAGCGEHGRRAVERFRDSAPYLPLFARAIRRIELDGSGTYQRGEHRPVPGVEKAHVVAVDGPRGFRALLLDLGEGFTMAMKLGDAGPERFPDGAPRLWWTAPLDEPLAAGWMLNGPFSLAANRVRLADGDAARTGLFARLGSTLGIRLVALHEAAAADWPKFADFLGLDATPSRFAASLWNLFRRDLVDGTARMLHGPGRGLGALAAEKPVVPAGRRGERRIRAGEVAGIFAGALCDGALQDAVAGWDSAAALSDGVVDDVTAVDLRLLGFAPWPSTTATGLLRLELDAASCRVSPGLADRLSRVFSAAGTHRPPLQQEGQAIREVAAGAEFRDRSGAWRTARGLVVPRQSDDVDDLRAAFAPDDAVLADDYGPEASTFVLLARAQAGYPPSHQTMLDWARRAATGEARSAALRYLTTQSQWDPFAEAFRSNPPGWAEPLDVLAHSHLTAGWTAEMLNRLRAVLHDYTLPNVSPPADAPPAAEPDIPNSPRSPTDTLEAIWRWWDQERDAAIDRYEGGLYPAGFRPADLRRSNNRLDVADREGWFSFLALACFSGFGGAQDGQHRTFIDGQGHDWWRELAQAVPERDDHVWLARLKSWSGAEQADLSHWRWRRTLVDLYKIARWLPQYAWMFSVLPGAVRQAGAISLNDLLTPSFSRAWQDAGLEAAPLPRSLGLGANWAIRELLRARFWTGDEAYIMAPYAFASTRRARSLLNRLGADLGEKADMDLSRPMWNFVVGHIPHRCADLLRDGDLPLQIYALNRGDFLEPDVRPPDLPLDHGGGSVDEDEDGDGLFRDAAE